MLSNDSTFNGCRIAAEILLRGTNKRLKRKAGTKAEKFICGLQPQIFY
jgi:hypothetical protein